jgi:large subunit ribosomal protein L9e
MAAKVVAVEGLHDKLTCNFKHLNLDYQLQDGGRKLKVDAWFGTHHTTPRSPSAPPHPEPHHQGHQGYRYRMHLVYAHFPINASITNNNTTIEII